jgi:hypothetical protein
MEVNSLIKQAKEQSIVFKDVIAFIDTHYQHQPTAFKNGELSNAADQNQGSARLFSFAKLHNLGKEDTLALFVEHYQAVLNTPEGTDHQNIRQFMQHGWEGIAFEGQALTAR